MARYWKLLVALLLAGLTLFGVWAQNGIQPEFGDPPIASLITISPPDDKGIVTITGAANAVFPGAQVAIRNLYTEAVVYVQAGITGTFSAKLYGPGNTPFWISPANNIPNGLRNRPGALPGGPGVIIYGSFSAAQSPSVPVTQLVTDGELSDWAQYPSAALASDSGTVFGLMNQDSYYIGLDGSIPGNYTTLSLTFTLEGAVYNLSLDPRLMQPANLRRLQPNEADLGALIVPARQTEAIELRIPLSISPSSPNVQAGTLERVQFLDANGVELLAIRVEQAVPTVDQQDGPARTSSRLGEDFIRFTVSGVVGQGGAQWTAQGRINQLVFQPGDQLALEMDVILDAPDLPENLMGLQMLGRLDLQPLAGGDGAQAGGGLNSNNGWSHVRTPSGLGIANLRADFPFATAFVPASQVVRRGQQLIFPMDFAVVLPDDLPAGMYVPLFYGAAQVSDGEPFDWEANSLLANGEGISRAPQTRLPIVLNVGNIAETRLIWTLFQDDPSDGSRGLLSEQDQARYALVNRVHFDSPTYILPPVALDSPTTYALEPYLLNLLPNSSDTTAAPLIPFLFPGGRLNVRVTRPDGQVDDLGDAVILQNRLSTPALDDQSLFGGESQLDVYRLTTLNPTFTNYNFSQYGQYQIEMDGSLEDVWGNRYTGGGTYSVLIAEQMDLLPQVLPGTPFEVGDWFNAGLHLAPGVPADVILRLRIYPLDGSAVIEKTATGKANAYGYFHADPIRFEVPGEYIVDYEARFTDVEGRLWAASLRGAGVIARSDGPLQAHGQRGLDDILINPRPAWFNVNQYLGQQAETVRLNFPYHSGDVVWVNDGAEGQLKPIIQVQDMIGAYAAWIAAVSPDRLNNGESNLLQAAVKGELPLAFASSPDVPAYRTALAPEDTAEQAYYYISAVRPDISLRQFVAAENDGLLTYMDWDDPASGQIGTGIAGNRVGDYVFLFGGAVVRNGEANVRETAIYGAVAMTVDPQHDELGARVYPPYRGEAGGPDGGPLLVINNQEVNLFFHSTGVRPGDVLEIGDTLAIAGQFAPALASQLSVTITSPSGQARQFEGTANAIGYFYDPANDFTVDEPGIWTVDIRARHEGLTSAGLIEPPPPIGAILGASNGRYMVYVLPADTEQLAWNGESEDQIIPPSLPYNFTFPIPEGWTDVQVFHTVRTPSYVLEQGPLRVGGTAFGYQYNPTNLGRNFPNLETNGQGSGPASSDMVMLTVVATGNDANGRSQIRARTFTIMHDRLMTLE